jgi:predicted amidophosphoribosyltransferase
VGELAQRWRVGDSASGRRAGAVVGAMAGLLLPRCCLVCGRACAAPAVLGLCPQCAGDLAAAGEPACGGCSEPLPGDPAPGLCGACLRHPPPWSRLDVGWLYRAPLDRVVRAI